MFAIQFDAAGIYKVGTRNQQFHVSFEEMISFKGGIIALLEYGLPWKVLKGVLGRARHQLWQRPGGSVDTQPAIWIDNSGPVLYEIRHGLESIRICPEELETSRLGKAIKLYWDGGMTDPKTSWIVRMVVEAFFVGIWRIILRRLKTRAF